MRHIISAGIIIFRKTDEGIKYLLLYHGHGYWNFAKGKVEHAERSFQTALREIREETGLRQNELKFQPNFKAYERFSFGPKKNLIFKTVILYLAETKQPVVKISFEHEGFGWFSFSEAQKLLSKYKDSVAILRRAQDFLHPKRKGEVLRKKSPERHPIPAPKQGEL